MVNAELHLVEAEDAEVQGSGLSTQVASVKVGNKRLKITIDVYDSDDEFDEWLAEPTADKFGYRPRSLWVHPMYLRREQAGEYVTVCLPLRQYPDRFRSYYRMSVSTHDYILNTIKESLRKHSNRPSILPGEMLAVTIRYLSTGMSFEALGQSFLMSPSTVGVIVHKVCTVIYEKLQPKHMSVPSPQEFKKIADDYENLWQFPNCIGAIDGKHIRIKCPPNSGSMFWNYKLFYSVVLQAVADANLRFIFIDVGAYGKQSDGGIFEASSLSKFIAEPNNFPPNPVVKGMNVRLPYLFVCDDAYPLKENMLKPFPGANLTPQQDIYNGRLSRARRCVECAFGILVNKWRLLLKSIETTTTPEDIVKCAAILHNIVIERDGIHEQLLSAVQEKIDSKEMQNSLHTGRRYNHSSHSAVAIRNYWMQYFNSVEGAVPWQNKYIK